MEPRASPLMISYCSILVLEISTNSIILILFATTALLLEWSRKNKKKTVIFQFGIRFRWNYMHMSIPLFQTWYIWALLHFIMTSMQTILLFNLITSSTYELRSFHLFYGQGENFVVNFQFPSSSLSSNCITLYDIYPTIILIENK